MRKTAVEVRGRVRQGREGKFREKVGTCAKHWMPSELLCPSLPSLACALEMSMQGLHVKGRHSEWRAVPH